MQHFNLVKDVPITWSYNTPYDTSPYIQVCGSRSNSVIYLHLIGVVFRSSKGAALDLLNSV